MADTKKHNNDIPDSASVVIPAELTENNNLDEYIQPSNLELLKARYGAIDEDEDIRNEGFELAKKSGLVIKQRPESMAYGYFSGPVNPKEEIRTDVNSPLSRVFDETRSEFDSDTVTFSEISFEQKKKDAEAKEEQQTEVTEAPKKKRTTKKAAEAADAEAEEKPKRKRTTKSADETSVTEENKPKRTRTTKKAEEPVAQVLPEPPAEEVKPEEEAPVRVINNRYGYDTHTRVIYVDESADDGIRRNSEEELSSFFTPDSNKKKRRLFPWLQKKK